MPLYYGERSWNSLNLRGFFQSVDAGGVTPTTYATSRLDLSNGVMTEREENSPLTSVISVQRNTHAFLCSCLTTYARTGPDLRPLSPLPSPLGEGECSPATRQIGDARDLLDTQGGGMGHPPAS